MTRGFIEFWPIFGFFICFGAGRWCIQHVLDVGAIKTIFGFFIFGVFIFGFDLRCEGFIIINLLHTYRRVQARVVYQ